MTPPEPPLEKAEIRVCYPQTEAALPRIQTQMPFPHTLVETLTHTASFVDQAGYLAKYATEVCNRLLHVARSTKLTMPAIQCP